LHYASTEYCLPKYQGSRDASEADPLVDAARKVRSPKRERKTKKKKKEIGNRKSEIGNRRSEIGNQKLEIGKRKRNEDPSGPEVRKPRSSWIKALRRLLLGFGLVFTVTIWLQHMRKGILQSTLEERSWCWC